MTDKTITSPLMAEEMHATLRDMVISEIKAASAPWQMMAQQQQDELIARVDKGASALIQRAVNTLVANQFPVICGTLESVTVKDEMKAVLKINRHDPGAHEVIDSVGSRVRLVVVDTEQFET